MQWQQYLRGPNIMVLVGCAITHTIEPACAIVDQSTTASSELPLPALKSPATPSLSPAAIVMTQAPSPLPPRIPELPKLPEELPQPTPSPPLTVPPEQRPPEPTPATPGATVNVTNVQVLGSTVFSQKDLDKAVAPFLNRELTFEELLQIRTAITDLYVQKGYTTSGAFLPPQDISSGVITVQVVEGELERVEIQGLKWLRPKYVRDRVRLGGKPPLNLRKLESALQLLQTDPLFTQVQAELKAGTSPGRSVLVVTLKEANFLIGSYTVENRESPAIGTWRHTLSFVDRNLTRNGDRLSVDLGFTSGLQNYVVDYSLPVNARNGTVLLRYERGDQTVIEEPFSGFGFNSNTETFSAGFRQPIIREPNREFALALVADVRDSQTFIFEDIPFSFSRGAEDGLSKVRVLRFSQDWTERGRRSVFAVRSQVSVGLGAFGATVNDSGADGRFVSWLGQVQWVRAWGRRVTTVARLATQLTGDSLLPLEQFSVGGVDTVRGYRQNQQVGDNGITGSFETRFSILDDPEVGALQLATFVDAGRVWNGDSTPLPAPQTLFSTGLGVRWQLNPYLSTRLDWGIPLNAVNPNNQSSNPLQDGRIFFSVRFQPY